MNNKTTQPREQANERALFEADMRAHGYTDNDLVCRLGWYRGQRVQDKWMGWQAKARALAPPVAAPEAPTLTIDNAPVGTLAPSIGGGRWYRTAHGWKWNGPDGSGGTFPRPGGDWNGTLIAPLVPEVAASELQANGWRDCEDCEGSGRISPNDLCARCNQSGILPAATTASASEPKTHAQFLADLVPRGLLIQTNERVSLPITLLRELVERRATAPSRNAAPLDVEAERAAFIAQCKVGAREHWGNLESAAFDGWLHRAALTQQSAAQAPADKNEEVLELHRQVAAERLRADQGWERAEAKSKECIELRERFAEQGAAQASHAGADTERLDWLRRECFDVLYPGAEYASWQARGGRMGLGSDGNVPFREAIDAAMSAATEQKEKP